MRNNWNNMGDLIDRSANLDHLAVVDLRLPEQPVQYTHREFDQLIDRIAHYLTQYGFQQGDAIAIASLNRAEYLAVYFGIMRAGFVAVPVNVKLPQTSIQHVLKDADAKLIFAESAFLSVLPPNIPVIEFDSNEENGFTQQIKPASAFTPITITADEIAQILYTSGSTGLPKGVPLSHQGQLWALKATSKKRDFHQTYLLAQPLFHMNGLFMSKRAFADNATIVILPKFQLEHYLAAIERYQVTTITAVPTMFARILNHPELLNQHDVSSLRFLSLGSAPITLSLIERIQQAFPQVTLRHGYGTTEAGPAVFGDHPDGIKAPRMALGYPIKECLVELRNGPDTNNGVLYIKNPAVLSAYRNLPEKTAKAVIDGWYNTGDVMRRDENGFFFFIGRADDMFVCAAENIYPVEVEKMLEGHPDIRQASVVPLPDEERAHVPVAFIITKDHLPLSFDNIKQYALAHGPAYHYPRRIEIVEDLPWAGTNKVDRNQLIKRAQELENTHQWNTTPSQRKSA